MQNAVKRVENRGRALFFYPHENHKPRTTKTMSTTVVARTMSKNVAYFSRGFDFVQSSAFLDEKKRVVCRCNTSGDMLYAIVNRCHPGDFVPCDVGTPEGRVVDPRQRSCSRATLECPWVRARSVYGDFFYETTVVPLLTRAGVAFEHIDMPPKFQELLKYGPGDHFDVHKDRQVAADHLGTLLLVMPSEDMEGGSLRVRAKEFVFGDDGDDADEHADDAIVQNLPSDKPIAVFIPLDVEHSVSAVTKGERLVAKAAVCGTWLDPKNAKHDAAYRPGRRSD